MKNLPVITANNLINTVSKLETPVINRDLCLLEFYKLAIDKINVGQNKILYVTSFSSGRGKIHEFPLFPPGGSSYQSPRQKESENLMG